MKKIQCTFRLPKSIVDTIDKQEGKTRTDKLLSLLDLNNINVRHSVITPDYTLSNRLDLLDERIKKIEKKQNEVTPLINSDNPNMNTHENLIIGCIKSYKSKDGLSAKDIANKLNELGYLTVALKPFTKGSVEGIIRRKL